MPCSVKCITLLFDAVNVWFATRLPPAISGIVNEWFCGFGAGVGVAVLVVVFFFSGLFCKPEFICSTIAFTSALAPSGIITDCRLEQPSNKEGWMLVRELGSVTCINFSQPANESLLIDVTPSGIVMFCKFLHCLKASGPICVRDEGRTTSVKFSQSSKALAPIVVTPFGTLIMLKLLQEWNKLSDISVIEGGRITSVNFLHPSNAYASIVLTPSGIVMDCKSLQFKNAYASIFVRVLGSFTWVIFFRFAKADSLITAVPSGIVMVLPFITLLAGVVSEDLVLDCFCFAIFENSAWKFFKAVSELVIDVASKLLAFANSIADCKVLTTKS